VGAFEDCGGWRHVCDLSAAELAEQEGILRPPFKCFVRDALLLVGLPGDDAGDAIYLIVPFELLVISLRFTLQAVSPLGGRVDAAAG
jgi:hypothetical protein